MLARSLHLWWITSLIGIPSLHAISVAGKDGKGQCPILLAGGAVSTMARAAAQDPEDSSSNRVLADALTDQGATDRSDFILLQENIAQLEKDHPLLGFLENNGLAPAEPIGPAKYGALKERERDFEPHLKQWSPYFPGTEIDFRRGHPRNVSWFPTHPSDIEAGLQQLRAMPFLDSLALHVRHRGLENIFARLMQEPWFLRLRKLHLLVTEPIETLSFLRGSLPQLQSLILWDPQGVLPYETVTLLAQNPSLHNLKRFWISAPHVTEQAAFDALRTSPVLRLEELGIPFDLSLSRILNSPIGERVHTLFLLPYNSFESDGNDPSLALLATDPSFQRIRSLVAYGVSLNGIRTLATSPYAKHLQLLVLDNTDLQGSYDEGAAISLAFQTARSLRNLELLSLRNRRISEPDIDLLRKAKENLPKLQYILK